MIPVVDETHDPQRRSFVDSANGHLDFPIQNLPFGIYSREGMPARSAVAIGDQILDLAQATASGLLAGDALEAAKAATGPTLNLFLAQAPERRRQLRLSLSRLLCEESPHKDQVRSWLTPAADCTMHLPARVGDYTDFYAGIHHARNVGALFRPDNPLLPNYEHVPIGYHGRASSIRVSGEPVRRPSGQTLAQGAEAPTFGPSGRLDIELELGVWIGQGNPDGRPVLVGEADAQIAGLCLLNDWSARDLQAWEYQPLGPFLAKNFLTTVSPWVVTAEALAPFRIAQAKRPAGAASPLPYLLSAEDQAHGAYSIALGVELSTARMREAGLPAFQISDSSASHLYWTLAQLVAHHTCGGCNLHPGDLLGTGTISSPDDSGLGSLLELTRGGKAPITLPSGETRSFLLDGDEVRLSGRANAPGWVSIGFGDCVGRILG